MVNVHKTKIRKDDNTMAVLTREQVLERVKGIIGDSTDDSSLSFVEDITDTLNDYETRTEDGTNWKQKFEQNDAEWRTKYKERFFSGKQDDDDDEDDDNKEGKRNTKTIKTFDDLFSKGE